MRKFKTYNFKTLYCFLLIFLFNLNNSYSEIVNSFNIIGNDRIAKETIILFSEIEINSNISAKNINESIKKLYETDYFKNIKMNLSNNILEIYVEENPIIQSISINGIKNKSITYELSDIVKKKEKYPFLLDQINEQKIILLNILKNTGYYFVDVNVQLEENKNNTVDIIYNFNLGEKAKIQKIKFIGNKKFKDSKLRNIIISEEYKFWKFISNKKYLDNNRIKLDENLLINYYKNKGYYDVKVKSSSAKLVNQDSFELVFNIDSGNKFFFNNIKLKLSDEYLNENFDSLIKLFDDLKGKKYSLNSIKDIIKEVDKIALQKEFVFVNARYNEKLIDNNKIDIDIMLDEIEKNYIERINIYGNFITEEKVIRNSLIVDEGDPFNKILFNKSINNIKSRNIFESVNSQINDSKNQNNKIINITVQEKPTGEIFAGAGTGTSGSSLVGGIKENNYLGKGIKLETNLSLTDDQIKGKFQILNPNYKNTDKSINTTIESTASDYMSTLGYKTSRTGVEIGTSFEQYEDFIVNLGISNYYEKLETSDLATEIKKKQEGDYLENLFRYGITINKLDQNFQPTDGYLTNFSQVLPIYSDDLSIENTLKYSKYHSITDDLIISAKFFAKAVNSIDDNVRVSKRVFIPINRLRGFENIGPKDGTQYIGGNYGTALNINSTLPKILNGYENLDLNFFFDAANLWNVDYDSSLDSNKIRSATGVSANWFTPIGPLSFSYSVPLTEANSDKTQSFRFQIGTSF
tara:strand:+ start:3635 stop:5884 length:2250 start_codon:yes stop_codon:yes gene_type:complete